MRAAPAVVVLMSLGLAALAQEKAPEVGDTAEQAADKALAAWKKTKDKEALRALAARDDPDPWLVADELCLRGEHDAAAAFARAAPRADTEKLPAYVASRRGKAPDAKARAALAAVNKATSAKDFAAALKATEVAPPPEAGSLAAIRLACGRGRALRGLGRLAESAEAYLGAGAHARELGWLSRAESAFSQAGTSSDLRSDLRAALAAEQACLQIAESRGNRANVARSLGNIGITYRSIGDYPKALEYGERVLKLTEELGDRAGVARALFEIGTVHEHLEDHPKALEYYERSLKLMEELGDCTGVARALTNIGCIHKSLGAYPKALEYEGRALRLAEELGYREGIARALGNIGNIHQSLGDSAKALDCQERALRISEDLGDREGIARALGNIGNIHQSLRDYTKALEYYERTLKLAEEIGYRVVIARALGNIALTHTSLEDHPRALEYGERALKLMEELRYRAGIAVVLGQIGGIHQSLGDYPKALDCQERALKLNEELGNRAGVAHALGRIGGIHQSLGDYPKALEYRARALKLSEEVGDRRGVALWLGNIGGTYTLLGDSQNALEYSERALKVMEEVGDRKGIARTLGIMGLAQKGLKDYQRALEYQKGALKLEEELGYREGVVATLVNIGTLHVYLRDYPTALEYLERALAEADALGIRATAVHSLCGLAATRLLLGKPGEAAASARRAVGILGQITTGLAEEEGARAREQFESVFDMGTRAALALDDPAELCFFVESGRAATLLEMLGGRETLRAAVIPEELRIEEARARAQESLASERHTAACEKGDRQAIQAARRELDLAGERVGDVIARIQRQAKAGGNVAYPIADSLEEIRGRVREREALVLYATCLGDVTALVVTRESARIVRLGAINAVEGVIEDMDALSKCVIEPLGLGGEATRVLVSPTGALSYVPFALLLGDREVVYLPSGTTYGVLLDEAAKRGKGVLALGDPDYGTKIDRQALTLLRAGEALPPLPGTRKEAKAIGDVVLLGLDATEAGLAKAVASRPRWRAVHLACHGRVDPERPLLSSLALSGGDFLTTLEVFRLKTPADLVVLSACETGKGKVYRTEGVVGFVRAFMFAGAPRVLVSLWKVDDEATQALMARFYELWNPKGGSKGLAAAAALKRAMEYVRDHPQHPEWKHPKYWAAWQLWGLPD